MLVRWLKHESFTHYPPVSDKQLGFFIDSSRCSGCKARRVAAKTKQSEVGRRFRRVWRRARRSFIPDRQGGSAITYLLICFHFPANHRATLSLRHLKIARLPLYKRPGDGIVRVDTDKCVGCGYCARSCPYGAPQLNEQTGQMSATCALIYRRKVNRPSVLRPGAIVWPD